MSNLDEFPIEGHGSSVEGVINGAKCSKENGYSRNDIPRGIHADYASWIKWAFVLIRISLTY